MSRPMPVARQCKERIYLLHSCEKATDAYVATLRELVERIGVVGRADRLNEAVEKARYTSAEARVLLEGHITQHGC